MAISQQGHAIGAIGEVIDRQCSGGDTGAPRPSTAAIHAHWKLVLAQGIVMMVLGFLAVIEPNVATLTVSIFVGWLFFIGGIFRALSVWRSRAMPGFAWS